MADEEKMDREVRKRDLRLGIALRRLPARTLPGAQALR